MPSKKIIHLQQFGIIHLSNPDLTYIRNPEINKIMFMPFHLLETYIRNPSLFFISFFTLPPRVKHRWQPRSARAYMRVGRWFLPSWFAKLLEVNFSRFAKIRWMPSWFAKLLELLLSPTVWHNSLAKNLTYIRNSEKKIMFMFTRRLFF
jgi:hypothetical protein